MAIMSTNRNEWDNSGSSSSGSEITYQPQESDSSSEIIFREGEYVHTFEGEAHFVPPAPRIITSDSSVYIEPDVSSSAMWAFSTPPITDVWWSLLKDHDMGKHMGVEVVNLLSSSSTTSSLFSEESIKYLARRVVDDNVPFVVVPIPLSHVDGVISTLLIRRVYEYSTYVLGRDKRKLEYLMHIVGMYGIPGNGREDAINRHMSKMVRYNFMEQLRDRDRKLSDLYGTSSDWPMKLRGYSNIFGIDIPAHNWVMEKRDMTDLFSLMLAKGGRMLVVEYKSANGLPDEAIGLP